MSPRSNPHPCHGVSICLFSGWGERELSVAEIFGRLDADGSGTLDLSEVERLTAALGVVLSRTSAQEMFAQVRHQHQQTGLSVMCSVASVRLGSHCS